MPYFSEMIRRSAFLFLTMILGTSSYLIAQKQTFLALGDSYTICEGLAENERWPNLIVEQLKQKKLDIVLAENLSRTGYTTDNLIKYELPVLKTTRPDIVSVLIGVNDYVRGYDTSHFHKNLNYILDEVQKASAIKTNVILITIPDYSVTPSGENYTNGRNVGEDLKIWNGIIKIEAKKRSLAYVDIFPTTQKMKNDENLIGEDGLHPSAKEVALWANLIYPEIEKMVKNGK